MVRDLFKKIVFLAILSGLSYLAVLKWHSFVFGAVLLSVYFGYLSKKSALVLTRVFDFESGAFRTRILAIFFNLVTLGWILGFIITFFRLTSSAIAIAFFANGFFYILAGLLNLKNDEAVPAENSSLECEEEVPHAKVGVFFYIVLVLAGFYFLFVAKSFDSVVSPWQVINQNYIYFFFFATLILGILILFSKLTSKTVLFLVVLHSLLLHSYLPLTHNYFYGADQWRHLGSERRIANEQSFIEPKIIGGNQKPDYIGRLSYANFWGTSVVMSRVLNLDLIQIGKWMLPLTSAIILTILLFEIGFIIGWGKRHALLFAWLGSLPFALQAGGSFSLPVNWGFLIWLSLILLILKKMRDKQPHQNLIMIVLGVGSVFGYALFFILFWFSWAVAEVSRLYHKIYALLASIILVSFIPAIEFFLGYSKLGAVNWLGQIKQMVGNFSGFYLAIGPRIHNIAGGNIIFNQIPRYAFMENLFTQSRGWLVIFMMLFFATVIISLIIIWKFESRHLLWFAIICLTLLLAYLVVFYFIDGEHVLVRRLDAPLAFLLLVTFFYGLQLVIEKKKMREALTVLVLSVVMAASYSLGPDTKTVSKKEFDAMSYIWSEEKNEQSHCVLADTYPLLALEGISGKEIVGGAFPIDKYFAQPERVELAVGMNQVINVKLLDRVYELTGADHCWFVGDKQAFQKQGILVEGAYRSFGDLAAVRYNSESYLNKKYNQK